MTNLNYFEKCLLNNHHTDIFYIWVVIFDLWSNDLIFKYSHSFRYVQPDFILFVKFIPRLLLFHFDWCVTVMEIEEESHFSSESGELPKRWHYKPLKWIIIHRKVLECMITAEYVPSTKNMRAVPRKFSQILEWWRRIQLPSEARDLSNDYEVKYSPEKFKPCPNSIMQNCFLQYSGQTDRPF